MAIPKYPKTWQYFDSLMSDREKTKTESELIAIKMKVNGALMADIKLPIMLKE